MKQVDWPDPPFYGEGLGWTGMRVGGPSSEDIRREMLRVCPKQPCRCGRCADLKRQLWRHRRARVKFWAPLYVPPVIAAAIALYLVFQIRASYDRGRDEAIQRYREECVHPTKGVYRDEVTIRYIDEDVRPANCEESIRFIWGDDATRSWVGR